MGKRTVKRRIFISNALMVVVTLFILLMINSFVIKMYSESVEHELKDSIEDVMDEDGLEELLEGYTIRRNEFILLFLADGIICIAVLVIMSHIFTGKLVNHIMEPLDALADGAERIRKNDDLRILVNSWKVYKGDKEIRFPNWEFELLKFLAMNPNIVFSKEQLFEKYGVMIMWEITLP